jgi:hypothetical protein
VSTSWEYRHALLLTSNDRHVRGMKAAAEAIARAVGKEGIDYLVSASNYYISVGMLQLTLLAYDTERSAGLQLGRERGRVSSRQWKSHTPAKAELNTVEKPSHLLYRLNLASSSPTS